MSQVYGLARLGSMRLGAARLAYVQPIVRMTVNGTVVAGTSKAAGALVLDLSITDYQGGTPNTATFTVQGVTPVEGQEVQIGLGNSLAADRLIFGGYIVAVHQLHPYNNGSIIQYHCECNSYEWKLNRKKLWGKFTATPADQIVTWIMGFTNGFSTAGVQTNLTALDIQFNGDDVTVALDAVAKAGGWSWVVDYAKVLHFGATILSEETGTHSITDSDKHSMMTLQATTDLTQVKTRVYVEGTGSTSLSDVSVGSPRIPVQDQTPFNPAGGTAVCGQNVFTYTGIDAGGGGALIGSLLNPSTAPTVLKQVGTGLGVGDYFYAVTYYDAFGETTPGPNSATLTLGGVVTAPGSGPTLAKVQGGNLSAGVYQYEVTYALSGGQETTPGPATSVTMDQVAVPSGFTSVTQSTGGNLTTGGIYFYDLTYVTAAGETQVPSGNGSGLTLSGSNKTVNLGFPAAPNPDVTNIRIYRSVANPGTVTYFLVATLAASATSYTDTTADGSLGAAGPATNTAIYRKATLTSIPTSSDSSVTARKIYRTVAGGATFKLVTTINDNTTTTFTDNVADASLGATAPTTNGTSSDQVALSAIPTGPTGTVGRKLYRTVASGSQLKLLTTIANNSSTTYTDSTADGSLGANVPTINTSSLTDPTGTVAPGATSLPVTGTGGFVATGGWVLVSGQCISYTGLTSGTALTGVPASGPGSITAILNYGHGVIEVPMVTGVPASGTSSIQYAIAKGDAVNLRVQRDNVAAQTALAALDGSDGIVEDFIADNTLTESSADDRGDARLLEVKDPLVTIEYTTRDQTTKSGRTITFSLSSPISLSGTYLIQQVTTTFPNGSTPDTATAGVYPTRAVKATSRLFKFEELLRLIQGK